MSASNSFDDLLVTKLEAPLIGSRIVPRRRLTESLKAGMERRLTLLIAPAGYGKTTLLVEWLSGVMLPDWRVVWLTVDAFDNKSFRLWSYIATALKKIYPRLHFDPQRVFRDQLERPSLESLTPLFNAIARIPYQLVMVLDDYQWITEDHVHEGIRHLLDHQPKNLHLLISSRVAPPFPVSRLRAQRQLCELSSRDLSFTLKEARAFISTAMETEIGHDLASSLLVATEGWVAGLQLVTLSLQGQPDRKSFLAHLPDENHQIFEYLTEEVLDQQGPELRDFLLKTSILSELSAPLCDAMLGRTDSAEMLSRLQQANLFIVPLDEQRRWFGYHRLFADTLQQYLRETHPTVIPELHHRASAWLQEKGYPDRAVSHALAMGDLEQAARILDACALQAVITFDLVHLSQWISRFSDELISQRPQLGIYFALANFLIKRLDKVEAKLQALEHILGKARDKRLRIQDERLIRWEIAAIRACLDYWQENSQEHAAETVANLKALRRHAPKSDVYFCGLMLHSLAEVYALRGRLDFAIDAYLQGCRFAIDYGLRREYGYSLSEVAYVRKMQGRLRDAERDYHDLIQYAQRDGMSEDVTAFARAGLAEVALERNQLDQADELVRWIMENYDQIETSPLNWIRQEWLFVRLARYYLARQDLSNARLFFDKAIGGFSANRDVVHYLSCQLIDLQVRIWSATDVLKTPTLGFEERMTFLDPGQKSMPARKTALVRVLLAQGEIEKALDVTHDLTAVLKKHGMNERLMEVLALKALAYQALGRRAQAVKALEQALRLSVPEGYRRVFTDEGEPMKTLLQAVVAQSRPDADDIELAVSKLAHRLLADMEPLSAASQPGPDPLSTAGLVYPMAGPFSHRELGIVMLIVEGRSTKEIAAALTISVNTAKVHIRNIYRKSGAHTRAALLQRVIDLGIVSHPERTSMATNATT